MPVVLSSPAQKAAPADRSSHGEGSTRAIIADAALWSAVFGALVAFRAVSIGLFWNEIGPATDWLQICRCFVAGARFDISVATYAVLPTVALTILSCFVSLGPWPGRVRKWLAWVLVIAGTATMVVDIGFIREYHDQFNHWVFGLIFDDRVAIAKTLWKGYPVLWAAFAVALVSSGMLWLGALADRFIQRLRIPATLATGVWRWVTPFMLVGLVIVGLRGSLGRRPVQLKDVAVTRDDFLNKLVLNPFAAFKYALKQHRMLTTASGLEVILPGGDIQSAAQGWFGASRAVSDLDGALRQTARGTAAAPEHIVLVVGESYDACGLDDVFQKLGITSPFPGKGLVRIQADAFVSAADGTMPSLSTIISGLPYAGVLLNYQPSARTPFPTAPAPIFKRLGYRTRFFYGGYLSWQRLGEFCRAQGFDEVFGGSHLSPTLSGNEWGVDDEIIFRAVRDHLDSTPSFNVVLTTSYHPPYSVDLEKAGFGRAVSREALEARGLSSEEIRMLGHLWYAHGALRKFVEEASLQHPRAVFAVTGDHWSRRTYGLPASLRRRRAVPFELYGREMQASAGRPAAIAGSHLDMIPTLVQMTAPKGFEYHAFGRDLLNPSLDQVGYGNQTVVTPELFLDAASDTSAEDREGRHIAESPGTDALRLRYRQLHALGWWRAMKGPQLAPANVFSHAVKRPSEGDARAR